MPPSGGLPDSSCQGVPLLLGGQFQEAAALGISAVLCSLIFILDPAPPCLEAAPALLASAPAKRGCLDRELSRMEAFGVLQSALFLTPGEDALEASAGQRHSSIPVLPWNASGQRLFWFSARF